MVIMVLGSGGQLGTALKKRMHEDNRYSCLFFNRKQLDVTMKEEVFRTVEHVRPHVIINCAALTDVDALEKLKNQAFAINAYGAAIAGEAAARVDAKLIHISTDYVFEGGGILEKGLRRPYRETDPTNPLTVYGKSKLMGEELIQQGKSRHVILRTAWLYGGSDCFVSKIIQQAKEGRVLKVVKDEIGTPTSTDELIDAIELFIGEEHQGLFHASCKGETTRYEFARYILETLQLDIPLIAINSDDLNTDTPRPQYSVLENQRLNQMNLNQFSHWKMALSDYLKQYIPHHL